MFGSNLIKLFNMSTSLHKMKKTIYNILLAVWSHYLHTSAEDLRQNRYVSFSDIGYQIDCTFSFYIMALL